MPSVVVLAISRGSDFCRTLLQLLDLFDRLFHLFLAPHDPDQILHRGLQVILDREWIFAAGPALKRLQCLSRRFVHLSRVDRAGTIFLRVFRRELPGALSKNQKIGKRISAQTVRAMKSRGTFARRE